jgi:hypothetical protein
MMLSLLREAGVGVEHWTCSPMARAAAAVSLTVDSGVNRRTGWIEGVPRPDLETLRNLTHGLFGAPTLWREKERAKTTGITAAAATAAVNQERAHSVSSITAEAMRATADRVAENMAGRRKSSNTAAPTATRSPGSSARSSTSICRLRNSQPSMRLRNSQRSLCRLNGIERMETAVSMKTPRGASSEPRTVGSKIGR